MPASARAATACSSAIRNSGFEFPAASHHRQPGAGRRAQGRRGVRPADRARHPRRAGRRRAPRDRTTSWCSASSRSTASIHAARGVLPIAAAARREGVPGVLLPRAERRRSGGRRRPRRSCRCRRWPKRSQRAERSVAGGRRGAGPRRCRREPPRPIWPTCAVSCSRGARSRSPRPADTTCCSSVRPGPARR